MEELTSIDYKNLELGQLEDIVSKGLGTFKDVGLALLAIREGKKYKEAGYSDFQVY